MNLRQQTLDAAGRNIGRLRAAIERVKSTDAARLRNEYTRLVSGLQQQGALPQPSRSPLPSSDDTLANPALPEDILREAVSYTLTCPRTCHMHACKANSIPWMHKQPLRVSNAAPLCDQIRPRLRTNAAG